MCVCVINAFLILLWENKKKTFVFFLIRFRVHVSFLWSTMSYFFFFGENLLCTKGKLQDFHFSFFYILVTFYYRKKHIVCVFIFFFFGPRIFKISSTVALVIAIQVNFISMIIYSMFFKKFIKMWILLFITFIFPLHVFK